MLRLSQIVLKFRNARRKSDLACSFVPGYRSIYLLQLRFPPNFARLREKSTIFALNRSPAVR
jgi:hypothetical protein